MRSLVFVFVCVVICGCVLERDEPLRLGSEAISAQRLPDGARPVFRVLSVCELAYGAGIISRGTHRADGARRQLRVLEALKGPSSDLGYDGDPKGIAAGDSFVFLWTLGTRTTEVMGQGVFRRLAPGVYANGAGYQGGLRSDGSIWGGISEAELRAGIEKGLRASSLADCREATASPFDAGSPTISQEH